MSSQGYRERPFQNYESEEDEVGPESNLNKPKHENYERGKRPGHNEHRGIPQNYPGYPGIPPPGYYTRGGHPYMTSYGRGGHMPPHPYYSREGMADPRADPRARKGHRSGRGGEYHDSVDSLEKSQKSRSRNELDEGSYEEEEESEDYRKASRKPRYQPKKGYDDYHEKNKVKDKKANEKNPRKETKNNYINNNNKTYKPLNKLMVDYNESDDLDKEDDYKKTAPLKPLKGQSNPQNMKNWAKENSGSGPVLTRGSGPPPLKKNYKNKGNEKEEKKKPKKEEDPVDNYYDPKGDDAEDHPEKKRSRQIIFIKKN